MKSMEITELAGKIRNNIKKVIVGCDDAIDLCVIALLCKGHILLEDVPGTGKTMMARSLARSVDCRFSRIQFTPDLLPSDVTGSSIYDQQACSFSFKCGPVFTNILLADEINRATPRTQSALLECMEERQVTVDGSTYALEQPFMVIATQNPLETQGTFPLPEAQLDRFLIKTAMGYPGTEDAVAILGRFNESSPITTLVPAVTSTQIIAAQNMLPGILVTEDIKKYIVAITENTRKGDDVLLGVSPRGSLALMRASQAKAAMDGRDYVVPADIKAVAQAVLGHRVITKKNFGNDKDPSEHAIQMALRATPVPTEKIGGEL